MSYKTYDTEGAEAAALATPDAAVRQALLTGRVCGECKYFSLREGQRLMEAQSFVETLVKEHKWKVRHLGAPPEVLGDCGAHRSGSAGDETMLTGPLHVGCDQWRKR